MKATLLASIALGLGLALEVLPVAAAGGDVLTMEANTDRMGGDYRRIDASPSVEACHSACAADQECDAYTYVKSVHHCWLKRGTPPGPTPNNDTVSGVKKRAPAGGACVTAGGVTCEPNVDRGGADYRRVDAVASVELCQQQCIAEAKCAAFTFVRSARHCWLKDAVPAATANGDTVSGVKLRGDAGSGEPPAAAATRGVDLAGTWVFGPNGESWTFVAKAPGRYEAQESGFASASGTATVNGREFRLDFAFPGGSGYYLGTISPDGTRITTTRYHDGTRFTFVRGGSAGRPR